MRHTTDQRGFLLIGALYVVSVVALLATVQLSRTATEVQWAGVYRNKLRAFHLAEAGLDAVLQCLRGAQAQVAMPCPANVAAGFELGYTSLSGHGGYDATVTSPTLTLRQIVSTGYYPSNTVADARQHRIEAVVSVRRNPSERALFAESGLHFNSNTVVDSYDSRVGPYGGANVQADGDIGSNGTIPGTVTLTSNAVVNGDAAIGPSGNVNTAIVVQPGGGAMLNGSRQVLPEPVELFVETFPGGTATQALVVTGNQTQTLFAGTYHYSHVTLDSNGWVLVDGDITLYVDDYFLMDSNSQFKTVFGAGSVTIIVKGTGGNLAMPAVELKSNSLLTAGNHPERLSLIVTGTKDTLSRGVSLNGGSPLHPRCYGTIDAPRSMVTMDSNAQLFGAVIGHAIQLDSNAEVHYDVALRDPTRQFRRGAHLRSWREP